MRFIGINAGNGVLVHPFKKYLVANYEARPIFKTPGDIQWCLNFGDIPLYTKYSDIEDIGIYKDIDGIVSAPDCGHSSVLAYSRAKKLSNPKDNPSLNMFIKGVLKIKPKVFLMENLSKMTEMFTRQELESTFSEYQLISLEGPVSEFGNSQENRVRLVLIGYRKDLPKEIINKAQYSFTQVYKVSKIKTAGELIRGLEVEDYRTGNVREKINQIITIYAGCKMSLLDIQRYWAENPKEKRFLVKGKNFTTAPGVYRNLESSLPATARKANRQYNHYGLQLTPRELARIQGVPDRFIIYMDPNNLQYWINKGRATVTKTPPYEIGYWFYKQCKKVLL